MYQPSVTIVMPVYNAASTLDATISSVLAQTIDDFEFIIVDDGSADDSLARLLAHAAKDARIRVISQQNAGVSRARNLGAEMGKARYIAFIDADDLWVPEKLARHLAVHRDRPELSASYAKIAFITPSATSTSDCRTESRVQPAALQLLDVLGENPVCTASNLFVRRDAFLLAKGFDESLSHAEDQDFVACLIANGALVESIDHVLVGYRFSPDGLSMDLDRMKAGWHAVAARYLTGRELAALEALYLRYMARRTLRSGGPATKALAYSREGLRIDARAFLANRRRGFATLAGAAIAPFLPSAIRRHVFA